MFVARCVRGGDDASDSRQNEARHQERVIAVAPFGRWLRRKAGAGAVLCCALLLLTPSQALANGFDLFGAGSRGRAMGNTGVSSSYDHAAVYYNPSAMVLGPSFVGGGFWLTPNNLAITLGDRPAGYDMPDLGNSGPAIATDRLLRQRTDVAGLDTTMGIDLGGTTDLGLENLRLGFLVSLNLTNSTDQVTRFPDEREQYYSNSLAFELLGSRLDHATILLGAAYRIVDWFAVGAGLSFMAGADTTNFVYVPNPADLGDVDINVGLSLQGQFRPQAGILVLPAEGLNIGVAFRDEQYLSVAGVNEVQVQGLQDNEDDFPFFQDFDLRIQYAPRQVAGGVSYEGPGWLVEADVTWFQWAEYLNHHLESAGFDNTIVPRLGAELELIEGHIFRVGTGFEPSPVPAQPGRTNYVDNDRVVASLGSGHAIAFGESTLRLSWHLQIHFLLGRTETKTVQESYPDCAVGVASLCDELPDDTLNPSTGQPYPEAAGLQTNNPGFPGWSSGGWLAHTGIEVSWEF